MSHGAPDRGGSSAQPAWQELVMAWRDTQNSPHTRRSYMIAWNAFSRFLEADPSTATVDDVSAWIGSMQASGQAQATIAARLAACASLYDYVVRTAPALLVDVRGRPRANPFRSADVARPRVLAYPRPLPLRDGMVQKALARINRNCLTGARDAALLLTFLMTGWRNAEVLGLTYAGTGAEPSREQPSQLWRGGGKQEEPIALPATANAAILH